MSDRPATCRCASCGAEVECCELCESRECAAAVCYGCLTVTLGQATPQPHEHGG